MAETIEHGGARHGRKRRHARINARSPAVSLLRSLHGATGTEDRNDGRATQEGDHEAAQENVGTARCAEPGIAAELLDRRCKIAEILSI